MRIRIQDKNRLLLRYQRKASMNLSQLLEDLQAFEKAVREEDIPEIYRLYNGRLNEELKEAQMKITRSINC